MREGDPQFNINTSETSTDRYAVIVARWNQKFNDQMLAGAKDAFKGSNIPDNLIDVFYAPGAFEIPVLAQNLAESGLYEAIVCLATVIRGETYHFELVANESTRGIMQVSIDSGVPVINGILAVDSEEQAEERASASKENKGFELAMSAVDIVQTIDSIDVLEEDEEDDEEEEDEEDEEEDDDEEVELEDQNELVLN